MATAAVQFPIAENRAKDILLNFLAVTSEQEKLICNIKQYGKKIQKLRNFIRGRYGKVNEFNPQIMGRRHFIREEWIKKHF